MCLGLEMGWDGRAVREGRRMEDFNGGKEGRVKERVWLLDG
jgi:hypothetical protein